MIGYHEAVGLSRKNCEGAKSQPAGIEDPRFKISDARARPGGYLRTSWKAGMPSETTSTPNSAWRGEREAIRSNMRAVKRRKSMGV
jgi:hypothetical protein